MCLLDSGIWVHLQWNTRLETGGWSGTGGLASKVSASGPLFGHTGQVMVAEVVWIRRGKGNIREVCLVYFHYFGVCSLLESTSLWTHTDLNIRGYLVRDLLSGIRKLQFTKVWWPAQCSTARVTKGTCLSPSTTWSYLVEWALECCLCWFYSLFSKWSSERWPCCIDKGWSAAGGDTPQALRDIYRAESELPLFLSVATHTPQVCPAGWRAVVREQVVGVRDLGAEC